MSNLTDFFSSRRFRLFWLIPAGLAAAILLSLLVTRFGPTLFAPVAGVLVGLLLYTHVDLGLYMIALSLPIEDLLPGIGPATGARVLGMTVFGVWIAGKLLRRESWIHIFKSPLILGVILFLGWSIASILWADHKDFTISGLISQVQLIALALLVIDLVNTWDRAVWVVRFMVLGGIIAAVFTAEQYFIAGIRRAGDGISGGVNFTASSLVSLMPFAFYLIRSRARGFWSFLGTLYVPLGIVAVTVTFSRTSYIFLMLVLFIHALLLMRSRSGIFLILLISSVLVAVYFSVPQGEITERVDSISPTLANWITPDEVNSYAADVRAYHWQVGFEMYKDSPLLGVGFGNFGILFIDYQFEVQGLPDIFRNPRSPHSSYVGLLTELGVLGLGLFLFILGAALYQLVQVGRRLRIVGDDEHLFLVQTVYYVVILQILYGLALNTHLNKNFWLILGLCSALAAASLHQQSTNRSQLTKGGDDG